MFFLGDLNYRVELPREVVLEHVSNGNYEPLYDKDQLNKQIQSGSAFNDFKEGRITFAPTFKFEKGTSQYEDKV